ncbi:MAG: acetolactate synthase small subunit, partial [Pseudomonadota bacterium]
MRRIISLLMENEPGALSCVVGLFSQRGYNIESLNVAQTEDSSLSRLTLTTSANEAKMVQILKHLNGLIDVARVVDLTDGEHIERELMLIKINANETVQETLNRCTEKFHAQIV